MQIYREIWQSRKYSSIHNKCFFYVKNTYYNERIWTAIVGLNVSYTAKLKSLLKTKTNNQLFTAFKRIFIREGEEYKSWGDFMDLCEYSGIEMKSSNSYYCYNKEQILFQKFLFNELNNPQSVYSDRK